MPRIAPYSPEFRAEAVRLLRSSGRSIPQLSKELGVSEQSLRNWSRQVDVDDGRATGLSSDERGELRRLRRENRILAEEREILKKAAVNSTGWRNGSFEHSGGGRESEGLSGSGVQPKRDLVELVLAVC
jgi:transposase